MCQLGGGYTNVFVFIGVTVVREGGTASLEFEGEVLHPGGVIAVIVVVVAIFETTGFGEEMTAYVRVGVDGRGGGNG